MAIEQIEIPTVAQLADGSEPASAAGGEAPAALASENHSESGFLNRVRDMFTPRASGPAADAHPDAPAEQSETADPRPHAADPASEAGGPSLPQPYLVFGSEEEYRRHLQSETDRELARRERAARERQIEELERQIDLAPDELSAGQLARQLTALRRGQRLESEQAADAQQLLNAVARSYDEATVARVLGALPAAEQARILQAVDAAEVPDAMAQRALLMERALGAYTEQVERQAYDKAAADLRRNPAFLKEIVATLRDDAEEPDLIAGAAPPSVITQRIWDAHRTDPAWRRANASAVQEAVASGRITH